MEPNQSRGVALWGRVRVYALTLAAVAIATALRYALDPILGERSQYQIFYLAIVLVAVAGGLWPALAATALGAVVSMWLFAQPRGVVPLGSSADILRLVVFLITGVAVSLLAERLHVRRRLAEAQRLEIQEARLTAERARAAAEEASAAKDHFLAVLSHELRTPLTPVLTGLSLLEKDDGRSEQARKVLGVVRRNVELEAHLIDDLLDLTRVARGKMELNIEHVDLCTIIDRAAEICRSDMDARSINFGVDYGPRPYLVVADAARLQQVFWNLLKNAIKFTPLGGCIGVCCRPDNDDVVVEVSDSGIGIEQADLDRIFDAFAQAERSHTRQFGGLGLGLAISKALVEMHGGRIEVRSEGLNTGTTFRVWLPIAAGATIEGQPVLAEVDAAVQRPPLRVLIVEDHGDSAEMLAAVLELEGHRVVKVADVASALDTIGREPFDVLLSDLGLPDRSGLDLIRELRSQGRAVPAIALSGYGQERDIQQSREAGFAEHLVKPVDSDRLLKAMRRVTGSAQDSGVRDSRTAYP
jgi:two-component system, chemotaxis family, CheB/CheR fusion protein